MKILTLLIFFITNMSATATNSLQSQLGEYRKQIDEQDMIILNSLEKRYKVVEEVTLIKNKNKKSNIELYFNMKREGSMLQDLINKTSLSPDLIFSTWRNFISFANAKEQDIDVFYNTADANIQLCKNYPAFCGLGKKYIISAVMEPKKAIMAILEINKDNTWWYDIFVIGKPIQDNLFIINLLPCIEKDILSNNVFAVLGYIDPNSLSDSYKIFIVPTKEVTNEKVLSQHEDMSLIITKNIIINAKLVGLIGENIIYDR